MHIPLPVYVPESSFKVPLTLVLQEDHYEEAEGENNSELISSEIHVKVELVDPDEVVADKAKFSKTL